MQKRKPLKIILQKLSIDRTFQSFNSHIRKETLTAIGTLQPTPISCIYTVMITYKIGSPPKVKVVAPELHLYPGETNFPHTYPSGNLCLYYPPMKEWTSFDYISTKIIPWISLWLYYYEIWSITGKWLGGGHEFSNDETKNEKDYF